MRVIGRTGRLIWPAWSENAALLAAKLGYMHYTTKNDHAELFLMEIDDTLEKETCEE